MSSIATPLVTTTGPEDLAHLVHYGIVAAGVAGVTALLLPAFLERARPATHLGDEHDRRVHVLRERVAHGTLAAPEPARPLSETAAVDASDAHAEDLVVPTVVISSIAAAGVHAAVAPPHLAESLLVGSFFVVCALAQLGWGALAWRRRTPPVLWIGLVGNISVLMLWVVSRTVGVPGLDGPEPVGPWDLTCALWEVVVVVGCLRLLRAPDSGSGRQAGPMHPFVLFWLVLSVLALGLLSMSGAHS